MIKINKSTNIISVTMINIDDGTEVELFERKGSKCLFRDKFKHKNYIIQLRLDFGDIKDKEPVLDADIWAKTEDGKKLLRSGPWHHNKKKFEQATGRNVYTFEFQNLKLRLGTKTTASKDIQCKIYIKHPSQKSKKKKIEPS